MNAPLKTTAEAATDFARRHIGPSPRDIAAMLDSVGAKSLTELMGQTLPSSIRQRAPLDLGRALTVMPREGGASSTPGSRRLSRQAAAYWIVRLRGRCH